MANGRFLAKSIAQNEQLPEVSIEAALLFTWSIPHLDRDGRMKGNPHLVKANVCPLRPEIDSGSIPDLLRELAGAGLVRWYECSGTQVVQFPGFADHQQGMKYDREAESRLPAYDCEGAQDLVRIESGSGPDQVRASISEVKGSEVKSKGSEVKDTHKKTREGDQLTEWLGPLAGCLDEWEDSGADLGPNWRTGLYEQYGPGGMDSSVWKLPSPQVGSVPEDEQPRYFAIAVTRMYSEGHPLKGQHFRATLKKVVREQVPEKGDGPKGFTATDDDFGPDGIYGGRASA